MRSFLIYLQILSITYLYSGNSLTENQKSLILKQHNEMRQMILEGEINEQPKAKYMPSLKWDEKLANTAEKLAKTCIFNHDSKENRKVSPYKYVGQNIAGGPKLERMWFDEYSDYNYKKGSCKSGKMCGHYTQIVWANTTHVGCALKKCENKNFPYGNYFVCNYGPGGNIVGRKPYETY